MAYVITSPCIGTKDRSCVDVCPVDCIHDEGDIDMMLYIDPNECIDCGACEPACPVSAIFAEDDVPDAEKIFIEINRLWYQDKEAARQKVLEFTANV
jgi:NAD-dependent dihydropyrimidine dehydrogenase PreA subunit